MRDRVLIRHFLQRFLDHDLISPHADRREVLTVSAALLVVSSLFLAFFLAVKYQLNVFLPAGLTSVLALDDRFFLISISMIVMGLVAVAEWDALALDARDTAVLGPLPIPRAMIVRAKFVAIALFAVGFDLALSLGPTILRPAALPVKLQVPASGVHRLVLAHALSATAAGAFAFVAVLGLRETCRAFTGPIGFRRIASALQAGLIVFFVTVLLLLPGSYSAVALTWLTGARVSPAVIPPLWFVGFHETIAGGVIDRLPRGVPPRRLATAEALATELYRGLWPLFHHLAAIAVLAVIVALVLAVMACAWNNRRLPTDALRHDERFRRLKHAVVWTVTRLIVRLPAAQAGFFFTLQALARSLPHRVTMAATLAVGLALVVITLGRSDLRRTFELSTLPLPILALQTLLVAVVLTGFRHVVRVPAEVRANWAFHLAWSGDERPYLTGVKRAALFALAAPTLLLLSIWHVVVLGPRVALGHFAGGVCVALLLLELLFVTYRRLPFASSYTRDEDLKSVGPLYVAAVLIGAFTLARLERTALASGTGTIAFCCTLAAFVVSIHEVDTVRRRTRVPIDLDERPAEATQRFELVR